MFGAHTFVGTVRKGEVNIHADGGYQEPPQGISKFVEFERTQEFRQTLLDCDVIIYDLMSNAFEEVDYVIKTLKTSPLAEQKTLVLLSSVMTWVNTPPKFEEETQGEEEGEGEGDAAGEEEAQSEEEPPSEESAKEEEEGEKKEGEDGEGEDGEAEEKKEELDDDGNPIVIK